MSKVTAKEFSTAIDNAIMAKGANGINHVLTQYMFGEKKFMNGFINKANTEQERVVVINRLVNEIKVAYQEGGRHKLVDTVEQLIQQSAVNKSSF